MNPELRIVVNGEERGLAPGRTIADLLREIGVTGAKIAVERNLSIAPRSSWASTQLESGDRIEIVDFVGGG